MTAKKDELQDELTITLRKPIKHGDQMITMLELREPKAKEVEAFIKMASSNPAGAILGLIGQITDLPPPIVGEIRARDLNAASEYLMAFLNTGQQTHKA